MKKTILLTVTLLLFMVVPLFSGTTGTKIVSVNPAGLAFGGLNAGVEFVKPSGLNTVFGGDLYLYSSGGWTSFGLGLRGGLRKYLQNTSGEGLYLGGYAELGILSAKYSFLGLSDSTNSFLFGVSAGPGYQAIFNNKYIIGVEGGFSFWASSGISATISGETYDLGHYSGVAPYGGLYLGIKI